MSDYAILLREGRKLLIVKLLHGAAQKLRWQTLIEQKHKMRYIDTLISHDRKNNLELILCLVKFRSQILYYYKGLEEIRIITIICVSVLEAFAKREGGLH